MISASEVSVLFHYAPPVSIGPIPRLFLLRPTLDPEEVSLEALAGVSDPIVTHSFSLLVEWYRARRLPLPTNIVDIESCARIVAGIRSSAGQRRSTPWSLSNILAKHATGDFDLVRWRELLNQSTIPNGETEVVRDKAFVVVRMISSAWIGLRERLKEAGEAERFVEIEVPVYNLMLRAQAEGVGIDRVTCERFIIELDNDYDKLLYDLSIIRRINVDRALVDASYLEAVANLSLSESEREWSAEALIEGWRHISRECADLRQVRLLRISRDILLRTIGFEHDRCWVTFNTMGTVTGRILAVDPALQHLKKRYRPVLVPDDGRVFAYMDYRQYEPTIMAALSCDQALLEMCREGDIYEAIGRRLPVPTLERDDLKKIYLSYSYGMDDARLARLVSSISPDAAANSEEVAMVFREIFAGAEDWKRKVWRELESAGRVGTVMGNYRYRSHVGELEDSERRWAISQVVQGTGALILKRLCILISESALDARIVLPMHDALLLEVPRTRARGVVAAIEKIFKAAFREACPTMEAGVDIRSFADESGEGEPRLW